MITDSCIMIVIVFASVLMTWTLRMPRTLRSCLVGSHRLKTIADETRV
jgi:hypothetical protein